MDRKVLLNAFSLNFIYQEEAIYNGDYRYTIEATILGELYPSNDGGFLYFSCEESSYILEDFFNAQSYIGHRKLTSVLNSFLKQQGIEKRIEINRETYRWQKGDILHIVQYSGNRLPKEATTLPPNSSLKLWRVKIKGEEDE